jgi:hypothetical protein
MDAVWSEIVRMLDARDPAPASLQRDSARALWAQVVSQDAATQAGGVYEAYAAFARHVAEQVEFSALVIPALVTRRAEIHGQQASWDGVQRLVETPRPTFVDSRAGVVRVDARGSLEAASLHVAVLSPDGELRFEGAGGIALLEELALADDPDEAALRTREESDPFADPDALREGVRVAFERSLAQTPPASAAGDAPSER